VLSFGRAPGYQGFDPAKLTAPFGYFGNLLAAPFARWDSVWYMAIASGGYAHQPPRTAFFPLYPLLMRGVGVVVGSDLIGGVVVSLVCFFVALVLLYRLVELELGRELATLTVTLLAFPSQSANFGIGQSASLASVIPGSFSSGAFTLGAGSFGHFALDGSAGTCSGIAASMRGGIAGFSAAMLGALYAYQGWSSLTYVAGEVKEPGRNLPRALIVSMLAVLALYVAANVAYFYVLSPAAIASVSPSSSVGVEVLGRLFGPQIQGVATALLLLSVIATLHVSILTNSRITYALAQDGVFFPWLAGVSRHSHVPQRAVVVGSLLAAFWLATAAVGVISLPGIVALQRDEDTRIRAAAANKPADFSDFSPNPQLTREAIPRLEGLQLGPFAQRNSTGT